MTVMEQTALQWVHEEARKRSEQAIAQAKLDYPQLQLSPASWVLPKLLRIVYQNTDQPVEALAPLIRSMLQEQAFATTGGDPCQCERIEESINETTVILVRVLERVRDQCRAAEGAG